MHFLQSPDAGLRHPDLRCDRILLPVQPCPILEITLGYWTIAPVVRGLPSGHLQPIVMRLALPPAAAVLTLMERSVSKRSGT